MSLLVPLHVSKPLQPQWAVAFFALLLSFAVLAYAQGWSGGWHLDDTSNLNGLTQVFAQGPIQFDAALEFVFSGNAGPLGRPIALASFLLDGSAWPHEPRALLYTNSLLHIINALLLWAVLFNLSRIQGWSQGKSAWLATLAAGLWVLLPLSVSGVLMAVQRMAVLSSTFMLLGLWWYLLARQRLGQTNVRPWLGMAAGLGVGTLLGTLSKEQAAIFPTLVWVLEKCWLPRPLFTQSSQQRLWQAFKTLCFYLPTLLIGAYLFRIVLSAEGAYSAREFDLGQRLWSQAVILWDYLRLAFLPRAVAFGPFHDDYIIYDSRSGLAWLALAAWLLAAVLAWVLRTKTRLPLLALLWFIVAHVIESSVVPLELYFEHRNYLALAVPLYALVVAAWQWAERRSQTQSVPDWRILRLGFTAYALMLGGVLWQTTSLFGQVPVAAQMWYEQHPRSIRAAQFFAGQLVDHNSIPNALRVLDSTAQLRPLSGTLELQGLQLACVLNHEQEELQARFQQILRIFPEALQRFSVVQTLDKLNSLHKNERCGGFIQQEHLLQLAQAALENSRISAAAQERSNLHIFMANLFIESKQLEPTIEHLLAALEAMPSIQNLQIIAYVLDSAGLASEITNILQDHPPHWPRNPWLRERMQKEWQHLQTLAAQPQLQTTL